MPTANLKLIGTVIFAIILIFASYIDIKKRKVLLPIYFTLFAVAFIKEDANITASILGAVAVFLPLFLTAVICGKDNLGGGDVKFSAMCGFALGDFRLGLLAVFIGCITCLLAVPILKKLGILKSKKLPFIPFLSLGFMVALIINL